MLRPCQFGGCVFAATRCARRRLEATMMDRRRAQRRGLIPISSVVRCVEKGGCFMIGRVEHIECCSHTDLSWACWSCLNVLNAWESLRVLHRLVA
eukprot:7332913-Lingulodinium_polyedra.AAC.1